jgi:tRNA(Ile2) C34 agmatinyltransferase TiaS
MQNVSKMFDRCPQCNGDPLSLGVWAGRFSLRCRNCGWDYFHSRTVEEYERDEASVVSHEGE